MDNLEQRIISKEGTKPGKLAPHMSHDFKVILNIVQNVNTRHKKKNTQHQSHQISQGFNKETSDYVGHWERKSFTYPENQDKLQVLYITVKGTMQFRQ